MGWKERFISPSISQSIVLALKDGEYTVWACELSVFVL